MKNLFPCMMLLSRNNPSSCIQNPFKIIFDDALALEMTVGKETWEPNTNLDYSQVLAVASNCGELYD